MGQIRIRYWAGAKAAAGTAEDTVDTDTALSLADVMRRAADLHPGRLERVLQACSALVGDRPVKSQDPGAVLVEPGQSVEFLPPFAGG